MRKFSQMSFADLAADDEIFSGFSAFNSVEEPEEEVSSEEDEGDELSEDLEETPKKKPAKAAKKKVSKGPELDGPVKVQGTGWTFTHGVGGEKYFAWDVLKAAYEAGYLEVANSLVRFSVDGSVIFVKLPDSATDTLAMGDKIVVCLGQMHAEYVPSDFGEDTAGDEISVFDVSRKFWETHLEFKGCGLALDQQSQVAVPVFTQKAGKISSAVNLYADGATCAVEGTDDEIRESLKGSYGKDVTLTLYESDDKTIFPVWSAKKSAVVGDIVPHDIKAKSKDVKEIFRLPSKIFDNYHGETHEVTADDFSGKTKIEQKDVINYLKQFHRKFASTSKKFFCDQENGTIYVSVASGTKG